MTERLVDSYDCADMEFLASVVGQIADAAISMGHDLHTVYLSHGRIQLIETTLTDGSKVLDVRFSELERKV